MKDTKRKVRIRFDRIMFVITFVITVAWLGFSIIGKSYNQSLSREIASTKKAINNLKVEIESLSANVNELTGYDTIVSMIDKTQNNTAVVVIDISK